MTMYRRLLAKIKSFSSKEDGIETLQAVMLAGLAAIILFFIIYWWNDFKKTSSETLGSASISLKNAAKDKPK